MFFFSNIPPLAIINKTEHNDCVESLANELSLTVSDAEFFCEILSKNNNFIINSHNIKCLSQETDSITATTKEEFIEKVVSYTESFYVVMLVRQPINHKLLFDPFYVIQLYDVNNVTKTDFKLHIETEIRKSLIDVFLKEL